MNTMTHTKRITVSAVCTALCCVLPTAFHATGISSALSPMHFPVLLCGLVCQLIIIPLLVLLAKTRLIPRRYPLRMK